MKFAEWMVVMEDAFDFSWTVYCDELEEKEGNFRIENGRSTYNF